MPNTLHEHANGGEGDTAYAFLDRPAVDDHAYGDYEAHGREAGVEAVFGDAGASFADVFLDDVVCVAASAEGANEVAGAWGDVEETGMEGRGEVEAGV